jgi:hypothetical protein
MRKTDPPSSGSAGNNSSSVVRVLNRLTGWPSHLVSAGLLLWLCWYARLPSMPWSVFALYLLWMVFFILWLAVRIVVWISERSQPRKAHWLPWSVTPVLFVLGFVVSYSGVVCRLAFEMNRPAFDRLAQQELASPNSRLGGGPLGVYEVEEVEYLRIDPAEPEEVIIYIAPFGRHVGFLYCPKCQSADPSRRRNLGGGWYTFISYSA